MSYPAPVKMKTEYKFSPRALADSMVIDGRSRILDSEGMRKALGHLGDDAYTRTGHSASQVVNNLCQETGVPVYARGQLLDEVERYADACITEGEEVYPSNPVLITFIANDFSRDPTLRRPGERQKDAYKRIKNDMMKKYRGNSNSYMRKSLIEKYEGVLLKLGSRKNCDELTAEHGPVDDNRVVSQRNMPADTQLSLSF